MKIGGLYIRMVTSFVLVLGISIMLMFALMHMGKIRPPFTRHAEERMYAVKKILGRELRDQTSLTTDLQKRLNSTLEIFASAMQGQIWVTTQDGRVAGSSFRGTPPVFTERDFEFERPTPEGDVLHLMRRKEHVNLYMTGNLRFKGEWLTVHLLHRWKKKREEDWLMQGLLLMSGIAALLLIPASRRLTRPLNELTQAAQKMAHGDFSTRVEARWRGELSVLAKTFNNMSESLEKMVRGSQELTANLSHELRSPLARIRISQQILQERMETGRFDGMEKHLSKMDAEIDHMDGLIDKILSLSKLDLQDSSLSDTIDMKDLLDDTASRLQPQAEAKGIIIRANANSGLYHRCNKDNMHIVFDNVLSNAIKYSPENAEVTITTQSDDSATTIEIRNPYRDLPQPELDTIFVPFKRLGYDDVEGNGLGLAFARKIIEDHGGEMKATTQDNVFIMQITLPV